MTPYRRSWLALSAFLLVASACGGDPPISPPPPAPGPAAAVDDFERSNLGPNWTIFNGDVGIVNGRHIGVHSATGALLGLGIVGWARDTFAVDQFSEAAVSSDIDPRAQFQVFVRRRVSDAQRYGFHWNLSALRWELKRDGGPAAPVLTTAPGSGLAPGDVLRIEARGSMIRGIRNGVVVLTSEDSVLTEPGQPGMALNVIFVTRFPTPFAERWSGGTLDR